MMRGMLCSWHESKRTFRSLARTWRWLWLIEDKNTGDTPTLLLVNIHVNDGPVFERCTLHHSMNGTIWTEEIFVSPHPAAPERPDRALRTTMHMYVQGRRRTGWGGRLATVTPCITLGNDLGGSFRLVEGCGPGAGAIW